MPWKTEFSANGAEIRYYGLTTGADVLKAKAEFFAHEFAEQSRYVLCDFTDVDKLDASTADVNRIINQDRRAAAEHPDIAEVVVAPQPHQYGLARMWEIQVDEARDRTAVV